MIPEFSSLSKVVKVIDVNSVTNGKEVQVYMNSENEKAIAVISEVTESEFSLSSIKPEISKKNIIDNTAYHWKWRLKAAEKMASIMDADKFGVKGFYIFGSAKNATSRLDSDIDLLIHFQGNKTQKKELLLWLDGWSSSLAYSNFLNTGYKTDKMLDIHIVTDEDIKNKTSFALKISAISDAARPLLINKK